MFVLKSVLYWSDKNSEVIKEIEEHSIFLLLQKYK